MTGTDPGVRRGRPRLAIALIVVGCALVTLSAIGGVIICATLVLMTLGA